MRTEQAEAIGGGEKFSVGGKDTVTQTLGTHRSSHLQGDPVQAAGQMIEQTDSADEALIV